MRKYRSWATVLSVLSVAAPLLAQAPLPPTASQRRYDGWQSVPGGAHAPADRKQAYFQASGAPLPATEMPAAPAGFGGASLPQQPPPSFAQGMPGLPGAGDFLQGTTEASGLVQPAFNVPAGGQLPPTDVRQASGSSLRNAPVNGQGVYPPGAYAQPPQSSLRSVQPQGMPGATYTNVAQQQQQVQQQVAHNGTPYTIPVVSQDPRFISPPPRVGNFATSPYQPYRMAAYQVNPPQQAQTVQPPLTQATQPAVVANASNLPQYQPSVGIHPTAYQAGYQYCTPSIPSGGVPQLVPGAVAPPTLPPNLTPQLYTPDNAGFKPLFSLGQENYNVLLGRGIIGQPTVYVPGQPVRNFLRYISP